MVDKQALCRYLGNLIEEHESKNSRTAIETMLKIYRNILHNENEAHFRMINPENPVFKEKVWSLLPARQFMKKSGWFFVHDKMFFNRDEALIDIIEILLEYRNVKPQASEWVEETKIVTISEDKLKEEELRRKAAAERKKELAEYQDKKYRDDLAQKLKEEELRRKAAAEREKELAEYRKDKKYRDDLAQKVRADIEADNNRRRQLHSK